MFNQFPKERWYLYDDTNGNIRLKHPYRPGLAVKCAHCEQPLVVDKYKAQCCGKSFKISFGEICQIEPVGQHNKSAGRGWSSLRPFTKCEQ